MPNPFEGKRVRLRATTQDDFATFQRWYSDPEIQNFQTTGPLALRSLRGNEDTFQAWAKESDNAFGFSVERLQDGVLVGQCGLWGIRPTERCATLGVVFGREYWNQGYGTEALGLVLNYAFNERNLHRVQLTVNADNPRGIRAYEKVGFKQEGRAREVYFREGQWRDLLYMAALREDVLTR